MCLVHRLGTVRFSRAREERRICRRPVNFSLGRPATFGRPNVRQPLKTRSVEFLAQPAQGKRPEKQSQIAQRNVEVARNGEQIANNQKEPGRDHVGEEARLQGNAHPGGQLLAGLLLLG